MSKSELKRLCAQNPVEMAERIVELEQRVKVLADAAEKLADDVSGFAVSGVYYSEFKENQKLIRDVYNAIEQTPQQTAEQIERWHVECDSNSV